VHIDGLLTVAENVYSSGTCGEIGTKPKDLVEAEILIDIHIREKGELRRKIEMLERRAGGPVGLIDENSELKAKIEELIEKNKELKARKAAKPKKYESKSSAAKARWERQRAERCQNGAA
jgi:hypothetical protein